MAMTLKGARHNADLTQEQVCECLKIGKNTLINYEKYRTVPSIETAQRIAELYGTTVDNIKWAKE